MTFKVDRVPPAPNDTVSSSASVIAGPLDVSEFRKLAIQVQNFGAVTATDLFVEHSFVKHDEAGVGEPPNWVLADPTELPMVSTLGPTATYHTIVKDNVFKYIRFKASTANSASAGTLLVTIGGYR